MLSNLFLTTILMGYMKPILFLFFVCVCFTNKGIEINYVKKLHNLFKVTKQVVESI